jgi:endonuclease/exonuclease/phosphatase family metal-dependent hydrolase
MRFLHWNVHMWRTPDGRPNQGEVTELIRRTSPDAVSLVEVDEPWGRPSLGRLAAQLGYAWAYVPAFEYRSEGGFGNALLSRRPFQAVQQWQLLPPRLYDGSEPSEPRAAILAMVRVDGRELWIGSTHLPRQDPGMRAEAAGRLLRLLDGLDAPSAVCGDFNQPPEPWVPDERAAAPHPALPTYPSREPQERIDYCLVTGAAASADTLPSAASDHLPLLVELSPATATEAA